MTAATTRILSNTRCLLGEGPFYCERRKTLYWFDILNRRRHAYDFERKLETTQKLPEMASAMAVVDDERDVIFTESGLWLREVSTGCWTPLCAIEGDDDATRSNDARVHPSGAFWLGMMGKSAEPGMGSIYHYRAGTLTEIYDGLTIPNAICFSPDGTTAYFTDTPSRTLMHVSLDADTGLPTAEPDVYFQQSDGETGGMDGAICDGEGQIWNARWGASSLDRIAPNGTRVESIELPLTQPSCPAFIGDGRIAVTSAWENMDAETRAADPNAGATIIVELQHPVQARFEPKLAI
ncbi:MAG: SMP-30/gluconolactonase/LRE family protein [Pseudomonadota bacterium]